MPAGEGNLRIGATVDTGELNEGFTSVQDLTQKVTQKLAVAFEECSTRTKAAMRGLSDDVKAAADSVSAEALKVAEATKAQTAAMADLRRAQILAKDDSFDAAQSTAILAAAQEKAAASSAELATAKQAEAAAVAEAAEEVALSSNAIVAGFQRAGMAVSEALAGMREKLVLTDETFHLTARDMMGVMSGMGELLGVGLAVDFAGHFFGELAKMNIELGHLRVETGLTVTSLAGLQQIVKESEVEWEPVERGVVRLQRALEEAKAHINEASNTYVQAFDDIGIKSQELKSLRPEDVLQRVAIGFQQTGNTGRVADAAIGLFSRGGLALIPILKEQGAALSDNMKKMGDLTGVTDKSVEASERWQRDTERLSAEFLSLMIPVIEKGQEVIRGIAGAFAAVTFVIVDGAQAIGTSLAAAGEGVARFGKLLYDATTGNFGAIAGDAEKLRDSVVQTWHRGFDEIGADWKKTSDLWFGKTEEAPPLAKGIDPGDLSPAPKKGRDTKFLKDEQDFNQLELDQLKQGHQLTLQEEINFWKDRLAKAKEGSDEYEKIIAKLAHLEMEQAKHPLPTLQTEQDFSGLKRAEDEWIHANDEIVRSNQEAAKQNVEAFREVAEEAERIAQERYSDAARDSQFEVEMGRETQQQRLAQLRQAALEEEQARLQAVHVMEMADMQNVQRYQQDLNREVQITREYDRQIQQLNQQTALDAQKSWMQAFDRITSELNQAFAKWLETGRGFQKSLENIWNGIAENFVKNIMKMTEQYLLGLALQKAGQKSQIEADAKTAAANTYQAVSAIPVVGPFLAPPAAAAAFAAVMAFESFNEGGVVTAGNGAHVPILAKQGERVLTPHQTQNFESLVNNNSASARTTNVHMHYNGQVYAYDRSGMRATLKSHSNDILDIVRQGLREGSLA